MSITPGKYDITLYRGSTFRQTLTWKDQNGTAINLTGWTARLQGRKSIPSDTPFITLTTENGGITLGGAAGTIELYITHMATAALVDDIGSYDLELIAGNGDVTRLMMGRILVDPDVTR